MLTEENDNADCNELFLTAVDSSWKWTVFLAAYGLLAADQYE